MESLEALFGLQLPLPPATVRQYMQGIAGMMTRCAQPILLQLSTWFKKANELLSQA